MPYYNNHLKNDSNLSSQTRKTRQEIAEILLEYESANASTENQRQIAEQLGISRYSNK
jgi:hypothetical protein